MSTVAWIVSYFIMGLILSLGLLLFAKKIGVVEWLMKDESEEAEKPDITFFFFMLFFSVIWWPIIIPIALLLVCAVWIAIRVFKMRG